MTGDYFSGLLPHRTARLWRVKKCGSFSVVMALMLFITAFNLSRTFRERPPRGRPERRLWSAEPVRGSEPASEDSRSSGSVVRQMHGNDSKARSEESPPVELACKAQRDPAAEELVALSAKFSGGAWEKGPPPSFEEIMKTRKEGKEPWREERVVDLIRSIVHPRLARPSPYQFDVCMTTVVRNEYYLKEFLVRNILAGFQKIFLYDDSWGPGDTKIANLIRPFVKAGVVEYGRMDSCERERKGQVIDTVTDVLMNITLQLGKKCMWTIRLDSDEVLYPMGYPSQHLPEWLAEKEDKFCEVRIYWLFTYAGGASRRRGFSKGETLLQSYPAMCFRHQATKHFLQINNVSGISSNNHMTVGEGCCSNRCLSGLQVVTGSWEWQGVEETMDTLLVHYYTKSLEDFVAKKEQSLGPFWRQFPDYYDLGKETCYLSKQAIPYSAQYIKDVLAIMSFQFTKNPNEDRAGQTSVRPIMTAEEAGPVEDYATYVYVKQQLSEGKWFNQSCYYERYPDVAELVRNQKVADATYYFVSMGFPMGRLGCWETGPEAFPSN